MKLVVRRGRDTAGSDDLLCTQTVVIVGIRHRHTSLLHRSQLPSNLPGVRPRAIVERVADAIYDKHQENTKRLALHISPS